MQYMDKHMELEFYFGWLTDKLKQSREKTERTIIYCQPIRQCGLLYASIKALLGGYMFIGNDLNHVLVEMLHSCTPEANKHNILESFQSDHGTICLLIAMEAFGMGVDCEGVHRVIHFGPSKNMDSYVQETGRAGRDGHQSVAYVLYHGVMLNHMKPFIKTEECRRKTLLSLCPCIQNNPNFAVKIIVLLEANVVCQTLITLLNTQLSQDTRTLCQHLKKEKCCNCKRKL